MAVKDIRVVLKKYRGAVLVLLCGIALMCLPRQQETKKAAVPEVQQTLEQALEKILSQVSGAGEVRVLLSGQLSETKRYQTDDTRSGSGELRQETVILTGENRVQTALVRQTEAATYRGAIVVCQGAENPKVALSVVQAVAAVTGLSTNRITVLKMK
jgi:stage III sporulation protein AG